MRSAGTAVSNRGSRVGARRALGRRHRSRERLLEIVVRGTELGERLLEHLLRRRLVDDAFGEEPLRVRLAHRRLLGDALGLQRLGVRGLVLLVVAESPVADEIDDDVVSELLAVGQCEPDRRDGRLGIVGVDVDDRHVEALREVARVARRASLGGIGREADLVVGDDVQRPARRVAVERVQVERLRDDALSREGRVAVDEDRQRDGGIVDPGASRAIGLLRSRETLDDRIDRLEMARVRGDGHLDLPRLRHTRLRGGQVVLDVTRPALLVGDERVDRALALELPEDRRIGTADGVREDVEPPAMRDPDQDLVRARLGGELDRLVEHRHEHVETLDRELLLTDERAAEIRLEALDLRKPAQAGSGAPRDRASTRNRPDSMAWRSQTRSAWSEMCSISYAIVPV